MVKIAIINVMIVLIAAVFMASVAGCVSEHHPPIAYEIKEKFTTISPCGYVRTKQSIGGKSKIDILFSHNGTWYHLESKTNINLDTGKSKSVMKELKQKHKIVVDSLDYSEIMEPVVTKIMVWTAANATDARKIAKKQIQSDCLIGIEEFFHIFGCEVGFQDFWKSMRIIFKEEVEIHFPGKVGESKWHIKGVL